MEKVNVLGINWDKQKDQLSLRKRNKALSSIKRVILHLICFIYDPLGFVTPSLLKPHLIVQEQWRQKLDWKNVLPEDLSLRFLK